MIFDDDNYDNDNDNDDDYNVNDFDDYQVTSAVSPKNNLD